METLHQTLLKMWVEIESFISATQQIWCEKKCNCTKCNDSMDQC